MKVCAPGVSLRCGDRLDRTPTESPNRAFSMVAKTQDPPPDLRTHDPWQPPDEFRKCCDDFRKVAARLGFQPNLDGSRGWQPIMMTFTDDQRSTIDASELHTTRSTQNCARPTAALGAAHDNLQDSELHTTNRSTWSCARQPAALGAAYDQHAALGAAYNNLQHSELHRTNRRTQSYTTPSEALEATYDNLQESGLHTTTRAKQHCCT